MQGGTLRWLRVAEKGLTGWPFAHSQLLQFRRPCSSVRSTKQLGAPWLVSRTCSDLRQGLGCPRGRPRPDVADPDDLDQRLRL